MPEVDPINGLLVNFDQVENVDEYHYHELESTTNVPCMLQNLSYDQCLHYNIYLFLPCLIDFSN